MYNAEEINMILAIDAIESRELLLER